jgi:hypothetical protein
MVGQMPATAMLRRANGDKAAIFPIYGILPLQIA